MSEINRVQLETKPAATERTPCRLGQLSEIDSLDLSRLQIALSKRRPLRPWSAGLVGAALFQVIAFAIGGSTIRCCYICVFPDHCRLLVGHVANMAYMRNWTFDGMFLAISTSVTGRGCYKLGERQRRRTIRFDARYRTFWIRRCRAVGRRTACDRPIASASAHGARLRRDSPEDRFAPPPASTRDGRRRRE
jgi:hypothetical protein